MASTLIGPIPLYLATDVRKLEAEYTQLPDADKPHMFQQYVQALVLSENLSDTRNAVTVIDGYLGTIAHLPPVSKAVYWYYLAVCHLRQNDVNLCKSYLITSLEAVPSDSHAKKLKEYVDRLSMNVSSSSILFSGIAGAVAGTFVFGNVVNMPTWL